MTREKYGVVLQRNMDGKIESKFYGQYHAFGERDEYGNPVMRNFGDFLNTKLMVFEVAIAIEKWTNYMNEKKINRLPIQFEDREIEPIIPKKMDIVDIEHLQKKSFIRKGLDYLIKGFEMM